MKWRVFLWGKKSEGQSEPCCGKENPPEKWGPPLWQELHARPHKIGSRPFGHLIDRKREFAWLVDDFAPRIPCEECREHFLKHLLAHRLPDALDDYADWITEFHNVVNAKLGKPRWRAPENSQP